MERREAFLQAYQTQVLDGVLLPPCLREQYRLVSCLKDGRRQVYLLEDSAGWPAVLKMQPLGREDTLRQEYDLLQRLRRRQIPRPLSYLQWEGAEYLIREYVQGVSLEELVSTQGPVSPEKVRAIALSLCQVLQDLHSRNPAIICRDVKPQNVVLDQDGCCHLIDLGAARRYLPEKQADTVFLGTQVTAPPEQFGYQQTDQRSDIYSLGMLMRYLCSGSFDPPQADAGFLRRIIRRCTAFDPKNRYPTVRAVYRALKYRTLRRAAAALAAVACVALAAGLVWGANGQVQPASPLLEQAIRQELQLQPDEPIPAERLDEVEQLLVCGQTLVGTLQEHEQQSATTHDQYAAQPVYGEISDADLELLAQCSNLRVLVLDYQQITDLSPLEQLPLEYLSLTGNQISNLQPLSGMSGLQVLDLAQNPVRSVEALDGLTSLREVTLEATGISSVEVFAGSALQFLNVRGTWVTDYTPLASCPSLSRLIAGEMPDGAAETLAGLTNLVELRLYATPAVDLSHFVGLQNLRGLDLYGSTISHPEALTQLTGLRSVNLGQTGVDDLSFLTQMPAMTDVDLRANALTDLTPLLDCPWLALVTLSPQQEPLAQEQLAGADFEIQYQE